jgi:hypothetical protein
VPPLQKNTRRLHLLLHHRLVSFSPVGLAGVRRGGEPKLYVEVSILVFSNRLSWGLIVIFFLVFTSSMEMASSTIINFRSFFQRRDLTLGVNGSIGRLNFSRYGPSDLSSPDRSWIFSHGCHEEYYPYNIFPAATSSTMVTHAFGSPTTLTRLFGYISMVYRYWYSCWWWLTNLMVVCVHVALALQLKLKL